MVTLDYNTKALREIHLVCCEQGHPNDFLSPVVKMGDRGEAYFGTKCGKEYMLVDKEATNGQFNILVELDEHSWNLDNALCHALAILLSHVSFHLED